MALKFVDIGANLTDPMFRGLYGGSRKHQDDLQMVLNRSWLQGLQKMIITVGTLNEADEALTMVACDGNLHM
ncbi:Putative deoxyribonuclease TATDN1 [Eumeta japonica]|uniref:Deoxyribonuclease TATDN1 n=1 Tax=Eumeta variegata TaxID=151549 RepID=A0A4C1TKN8_EUMVA|nr:Putative deoxyribonuclease TATDN1 [Eumeta japonica]